ncbi:MAG: 3-deoxy-D-manno-octulosonic acid transferase, partial [Gammaproteobacteria bacterium]|nr:3-deoxy-D-manno-octulosonic acid transferase [Gammaproteobacteria bacterium]
WYAMSQACYVGGSLNEPGGGHNILEPLALNVATVLGKNYFNFQSMVDEFVAAEAVYVVDDAAQAVKTLTQLLFEPALRAQLNQNAQVIMYKNRGALREHIQVMDQYL